MWGRNHSSVADTADTLSSALDDVKAGAKAGAIKGAAIGALGTLGAKAADMAQNAASGKTWSEAGDAAGKKLDSARKKADLDAKTNAASNMLQMFGRRAGEATQQATSSGLNLDIHPDDVPRLLRGLTLVATGLGTLFAPGSSLDASRMDIDTNDLAEQARRGIDTATDVTQQRLKDLVELTKDTLSTLSDALTEGIETAESKAQKALDETESRLSQATEQAADKAKGTLPAAKKQGGMGRWLIWGVLIGGAAAYLSSPMSGQVGERIANLRRDLGLGGGADDDSQYWPSPSQETTGASGPTASANGDFAKTESWRESGTPKENSEKS